MPTNADYLDLSIANAASNLEYITRKPRPTYTIEGATYDWGALFRMFSDQLKVLREERLHADGPFEVRSRGI